MIAKRSGQVRNVPADFLKGIRTKIDRYIGAICIADGSEFQAKSSIWAEMSRWMENNQKCILCNKPHNMPSKIHRNLFLPTILFLWKSLSKILSNEPYSMLIRQQFESVVIIVHFYENWSFVTK